jgi:predicted hydrocarbon binding protein
VVVMEERATGRKGVYNLPCEICKKNIEFEIPRKSIEEVNEFPFTYNYVHKDENQMPHSLVVYIDKQWKVRGYHTERFAGISKELINQVIGSLKNKDLKMSRKIVSVMLVSLRNVVETYMKDGRDFLERFGYICGESMVDLFQSTELEPLLEEISEFWNQMDFGTIRNVKINRENGKLEVFFDVYDCFECSWLQNIGQMYCVLDLGIVKGLLETKLKLKFDVKEIQCYANGDDHCRFHIVKLEETLPIASS